MQGSGFSSGFSSGFRLDLSYLAHVISLLAFRVLALQVRRHDLGLVYGIILA